MRRLAAGILLALGLIGLSQPLAAQSLAADVPLASGGSQRVLFAGPANPRAILIMFPGGPGLVGITASGTSNNRNFLVRTLPLWLAQGFAVEILDAPNGASLLGQRHTSGYIAAIDRAIDSARAPTRRCGSWAPARARRPPPMAPRISATKSPGSC
jgi:hypothetical protein